MRRFSPHGDGTGIMVLDMANLNPRITVEPGKMGGKPCIRGLRFTVYDMASYLASGMSEDEILKDSRMGVGFGGTAGIDTSIKSERRDVFHLPPVGQLLQSAINAQFRHYRTP